MAECPVCFGPLAAAIAARPPCGHEVCLPCLMALRQRRCVLCRADLAPLYPPPSPRVTLHVSARNDVPLPPPDLLHAIRLARQADGATARSPLVVIHDS